MTRTTAHVAATVLAQLSPYSTVLAPCSLELKGCCFDSLEEFHITHVHLQLVKEDLQGSEQNPASE